MHVTLCAARVRCAMLRVACITTTPFFRVYILAGIDPHCMFSLQYHIKFVHRQKRRQYGLISDKSRWERIYKMVHPPIGQPTQGLLKHWGELCSLHVKFCWCVVFVMLWFMVLHQFGVDMVVNFCCWEKRGENCQRRYQ